MKDFIQELLKKNETIKKKELYFSSSPLSPADPRGLPYQIGMIAADGFMQGSMIACSSIAVNTILSSLIKKKEETFKDIIKNSLKVGMRFACRTWITSGTTLTINRCTKSVGTVNNVIGSFCGVSALSLFTFKSWSGAVVDGVVGSLPTVAYDSLLSPIPMPLNTNFSDEVNDWWLEKTRRVKQSILQLFRKK
ncbi:hypothetical protein ADUPG1_011871 [Aduncisulcus paluster]|uniref:Uncharacterized protein n=1 Tax=Aduncisulcus paluster TaxID=2918883 RepID=A0ABQ5JXF6_9EUKA|nr:hypothetical protein ADUPG1_011871 [Aduncisulcus paluster]